MKTTNLKITPFVSDKFEPGAILKNEWGWEQTNVDFYVVLERKGLWVTVQRMNQHTSEEQGFMTTKETPTTIRETAKPQRKKIRVWDGKEYGFSFGNYSGAGICTLWSGKETFATHYA